MIQGLKRRRFVLALAVLAGTLVSSNVRAQTQKSGWAGGGGESFFAPLNVDWWYNWKLDEEGAGSGNANFSPMFWGGVNQNGIDRVLSRSEPVEYVLGFNEPERPDQASMTVATALSEWSELVTGLDGSGIKLVSPAPSDTGDGRSWLTNFMNGVNADPGLHVDAVAFHWYGANTPNNVAGAANNFLSSVAWYHNQFNLPVMITEFGIHDWGGNYTDAEIQEANRQFLEIVVPELEQRSYVAAYSPFPWFPDLRLVTSSPDGRIATDSGEVYAGLYTDGEVLNLAGQDQGDDIIYLRGGTLTNTIRGEPSVGSVYALSEESYLDGSIWTVMEGVRVASGATLSKEGPGTVLVAGAKVSLDGSLVVEEGDLVLDSTGVTDGAGSVRVAANGTLRFIGPGRGASFTPGITLAGGLLEVQGAATLRGVLVVEADSVFRVDQLANAQLGLRSGAEPAEFRKAGQGVLILAASPDFTGSLVVEDGTLELRNGSFSIDADSVVIANGATLDATGSHTTIAGDFVLDEGAALHIELDGVKLVVGGTSTLGGATLIVSASVTIAAGESFDVFEWASVTGTFSDFQLPALESNTAWVTSNLGTTGELATVIAGDFDGDGSVDAADYTVWRDHLGTGLVPWSTGDANGDGSVDAADHSLWAANFGATLTAANTIPEPAAITAAILAIAMVASRQRPTHLQSKER